ncbi:MAG: hypothetical protein WC389_08895 [Lutibacter sp.]|jgi:uncharacterized membrane protein YjdF
MKQLKLALLAIFIGLLLVATLYLFASVAHANFDVKTWNADDRAALSLAGYFVFLGAVAAIYFLNQKNE